MKLLLENWREYMKEGVDTWVKTIWISDSSFSKLNKILEDKYEDSQQYLASCDRHSQSCDANTDFWLGTLSNAGFNVYAVRDGEYDDGGGLIGHDWIVIKKDGTEIIVDAAAEQFDTEPHGTKYFEMDINRRGKDETIT